MLAYRIQSRGSCGGDCSVVPGALILKPLRKRTGYNSVYGTIAEVRLASEPHRFPEVHNLQKDENNKLPPDKTASHQKKVIEPL